MIRYRQYGSLTVRGIENNFKSICQITQKQLKLSENLIFDLNIVDKRRIAFLNKKYRKINKPTDVISFANRDANDIKVSLIGEIFICLDVAKTQAKLYKHTLKDELIFLFTHGLLHLLGFDHQTKKDEEIMFNLSKQIINKL